MEDLNNSNIEPQINTDNNTVDTVISDDGNNLNGIFDDDNNESLSSDDIDKPAIDDNNSNNIDVDNNSITYYSSEELRELGKPENLDTIDINKIPPEYRWALKLFQKPYTQKNQKLSEEKKAFENEKSEFEKEKLTFQEQLELFREEQAKANNSDILDTGKLSKSDENNIINISVSKASEYLGEELDPNNTEHIKVFNDIRNKLYNTLVSKRVSESISNRLSKRYGEDYVYLERAVQNKFQRLPYNDSVTILNARQTGRYDIIEKFYDTVYNELLNEVKQKQLDTKKNIIPPATIGNDNTTPVLNNSKSSKNAMYDTTGIF